MNNPSIFNTKNKKKRRKTRVWKRLTREPQMGSAIMTEEEEEEKVEDEEGSTCPNSKVADPFSIPFRFPPSLPSLSILSFSPFLPPPPPPSPSSSFLF